ncbi:MAG: helix-turn-helix domain-containing protein [Pseudomonas sp.]|uniref:AraC family transcriptional regulator n=1 Tax=Pseudomonas sp. TaxID=306 RepID=UPI0027356130|nr:helix-turn-helix domain-containing protein [Pseudomonas sp.]MDP3845610.1 helix-turn-helix domain-containing protein [Pseudomonas sp.]
MTSLALLLIGFSLFSALVLALTHFRDSNYSGLPTARIMGLVLLMALSGLQLTHFAWLHLDLPWVTTAPYRIALFMVAPAFFMFSAPLLTPAKDTQKQLTLLWHALPVLMAPWLPADGALPLAFVVGAGYLLWLARRIYLLRRERSQYHLEIILLGLIFLIAIAVSGLGLFQQALPAKLFFVLYAIAIGVAFFLLLTTLGLRPQLASEISESAQTSYANSTLSNVDCPTALAKLDTLMNVERIYADQALSLPSLAERLALSSHQLSELINAQLGKGFSRYLREQRTAAAKLMLCAEPSASVLSVGLSVGFSSQSNFYDAFREIEGMTPGQYRKLHLKPNSVQQ